MVGTGVVAGTALPLKGETAEKPAALDWPPASGHVERGTGRVRVAVSDLRGKRRERKVGNLILVVLDASASMETQRRMVATKGAVLSLLRDAYVKRDRVGLISFRDAVAEVVVPPTGSAALAAMQLTWLASGGTTPLSIGPPQMAKRRRAVGRIDTHQQR